MNLSAGLDLLYYISCVLIFLGSGLGVYGLYQAYVTASTEENQWAVKVLLVACILFAWGASIFTGIKYYRSGQEAAIACPKEK